MYKIILFPENMKNILGFTSKFRQGQVTLNTGIFLFGLRKYLLYFLYSKQVVWCTLLFAYVVKRFNNHKAGKHF